MPQTNQIILRLFLIILSSCCFSGFAQTNKYFQNYECWSVYHQHGISTSSIYYIYANGDSIIASDTLVKLVLYGTHLYGPDPDYIFGSPFAPSFLAKENNQILTVYVLQADTISDTIVTDYSRMDSLTCISTGSYWADEITDTNSFNYYGNDRMIYLLNTSKSFEGVINRFGQPFIEDFQSSLLCFSALDSIFYSTDIFGDQSFHHPPITGDCVIHNVGVADIKVNETDIRVSPNPATTSLSITKNNQLELSYFITDIRGCEVRKGVIASGSVTLNIETLEPGAYFIKFFNGIHSSFNKFIKS